MKGLYKQYAPHLVLAVAAALLFLLVKTVPSQAGDPDDVIGPVDLEMYECIDTTGQDDNTDEDDIIDIDEPRNDIIDNSTGDYVDDFRDLEGACDRLGGELRPIARTKIEGYVYLFYPDPNNPGEWLSVPAPNVAVIGEGISFEIFWVSEKDGYFYFYKTRFGAGPIVLNLRLLPNDHAINPNIVIESTGEDETWTVFLGYYSGDVAPEHPDQLKTPGGNFLPFGSSKYENIVGVDGKSALPGVGGVLPQEESVFVMALAALILVVLPAVGIATLRKKHPLD
jgi:hypothetical protein